MTASSSSGRPTDVRAFSDICRTHVLERRFESAEGSFRVIDFAPRFLLYERSFRPTKLVLVVEPLRGTPCVRVACNPVLGWTKRPAPREAGSHHQRYRTDDGYSHVGLIHAAFAAAPRSEFA